MKTIKPFLAALLAVILCVGPASAQTSAWKYTDETKKSVVRTLDDGRMESCLSTRADVQEWIASNGEPAPAFTLDDLKLKKGLALQQALQSYLYSHYDAGTQSTFLARYIKLSVDPVGNAAKLALLDSVDAWMKDVLIYYYTKKTAIIAAPDQLTLDAISWDFPALFDATDPLVIIPQVM